jgi:hypothetical protein
MHAGGDFDPEGGRLTSTSGAEGDTLNPDITRPNK